MRNFLYSLALIFSLNGCEESDEKRLSSSRTGISQFFPIPMEQGPAGLIGYSVAVAASKLFIWGGKSTESNQVTGKGYLFDSSSWTWTKASEVNAPTARANHYAVNVSNKILIWGGYPSLSVGSGDEFRDGAIYDPVKDAWENMATQDGPNTSASSGKLFMPIALDGKV